MYVSVSVNVCASMRVYAGIRDEAMHWGCSKKVKTRAGVCKTLCPELPETNTA